MQPESYQLQVYNPGTPISCPGSGISFDSPTVAINDPENPLKVTFRKRRRDSGEEASFTEMSSFAKKSKMMKKEEVEDFFNQLSKQNKADMEEVKKDNKNALIEMKLDWKESLESINGQLKTLATSQSQLTKAVIDNKNDSEERFKALEDKISRMENDSQNIVDDTVTNQAKSDSSWKAYLAREIFEAEHSLIVHGFKLAESGDKERVDRMKKFLSEKMKASDDILSKIKIREVCRLGAEIRNGKPSPILLKLGHPTERNQILPFSSNLEKGLNVDKNIPKIYQSKHKEFKRKAWKLKVLYNIQTQIVFDGFKMVLRYKKKDDGVTKYNYTKYWEWFPEPSDLAPTLNTASSNDPNKHETPLIDSSHESESTRSIIISGISETITASNANLEFLDYISDEDHEKIEEIRFKSKGLLVVICKDWAECKHIAQSYQKVKFKDREIHFTLSCENDPSS